MVKVNSVHFVSISQCFSPGSVVATVSFLFDESLLDPDPLKTLRDDVSEGKLGPFTVDPFLYAAHPG